jgi:hypothetical protein
MPAATLSAAQLDAVNSILVNEAGRIGPDIYTKSLNTSAWINLAERGSFPDEMGDVINVMTWERSLPGDGSALSWTAINTQKYFDNDGAAGGLAGEVATQASPNSCLPTPALIGFGQTIRSYGLKQAAVHSPRICVHDLRFAAKRKDQLTAMFNILKDNTKWAWETFYRSAYADMAEHKVVVTTGMTDVEGAETWVVPTGAGANGDADKIAVMRHLSQGILDRLYLKLVREGAEPWGMENGRPVFACVMSPEAQEFLFRGIGGLNLRDDFRYNNSRVNELLAPLGVERSYKGWFYLVDMFPRRFNITSAAFVEVMPFVPQETTNGRKFALNALYEVADIEEAYVYVREALEFQVPKPITSPGGGTSFTTQNYMGDFRWMNILHETDNPDGTFGRFRGVMSCAVKPVAPDLATVIRFRRCAPSVAGLACDATSDPTPVAP